jgi:hypothetical protein
MADQTKPMEDALQDLCDNLFDYMKQEKGVGKNGILPVLLADDEEELLGNLLSDEPAEPKSNLLSEATSFLLPPRAGCDALQEPVVLARAQALSVVNVSLSLPPVPAPASEVPRNSGLLAAHTPVYLPAPMIPVHRPPLVLSSPHYAPQYQPSMRCSDSNQRSDSTSSDGTSSEDDYAMFSMDPSKQRTLCWHRDCQSLAVACGKSSLSKGVGKSGVSGKCKNHGGGLRCGYPNCPTAARNCTGLCIRHGGGRRCRFPGCHKSAQGRTKECVAHGGGPRCTAPGCSKGALSKLPGRALCSSHGGGRRCNMAGCNKLARPGCGPAMCIRHGGGPRCAWPGCNSGARGGGYDKGLKYCAPCKKRASV